MFSANMAVRRSTTRSAIAAGAGKRATPWDPTSGLPAPKPRVRLMIAYRFRARLWRCRRWSLRLYSIAARATLDADSLRDT